MSKDRRRRSGNAARACVAAGECRPPHHGSKDTRHYCKGKVGVEHTWRWMRCVDIPNSYALYKRYDKVVHERVVCIVCMKLAYYSRERCAHCDVLISNHGTPPAWMAVPEATAKGAISVTLERVST